MITIGLDGLNICDMYFGDKKVSELYLGEIKVYESPTTQLQNNISTKQKEIKKEGSADETSRE